MHCYKCNSTEQLSIKSRRKSTGYALMICRPCRRNQRASSIPTDRIKMSKSFDMQEWEQQAIESRKRILQHHG